MEVQKRSQQDKLQWLVDYFELNLLEKQLVQEEHSDSLLTGDK